ncbi:methylenetetrahydrofolate reduct [Testicularia cyperi]|uniref:Methylenetetrahydrofolate reduct n=1 Tax=Testicularia cyperi TaxID=1882483 RepID=A0A317XLG3_9BASI|nr:methylenetetrahydrofolate reduct [Testicularia cyperi]
MATYVAASSSSSSAAVAHPAHISTKIQNAVAEDQPFWSFEFFPPKTTQGLANLYNRIARMKANLDPSWIHVTWGAGGTTGGKSLELAGRIQKGNLDPDVALVRKEVAQLGAGSKRLSQATGGETRDHDDQDACDVCLHLTCTNVEKSSLDETLEAAKRLGIRNILALRGDPPRGEEYWVAADDRFQHATDLVTYVRENHGDFFCIGVAGYPEGHADYVDRDLERDMRYLKAKQDAGAQFIVTQLFYDVDQFLSWYRKCREIGITIPILPGIMPIQNYQSFRRMTNLCKAKVPQPILDALEPIKSDDAAVKEYGVSLSIHMIGRIFLDSYQVPETTTWDEFPNGRYGDSRSPAFGEMDGYGISLKVPPQDALRIWGYPVTLQDISHIFASYLEEKIECIPWCDVPLMQETLLIRDHLLALNRLGDADGTGKGTGKGWWSVGSQPAVDGAPSTDAVVGFGPPGGFVFQKSFVELFMSSSDKDELISRIEALGINSQVTYFAGNASGEFCSNLAEDEANTVTWAVFPGKEIVQSTIIEKESFEAWREEAFGIWAEWELLFPKSSATRSLLESIKQDRWLVTVVHHDYKDTNALWNFLAQ